MTVFIAFISLVVLTAGVQDGRSPKPGLGSYGRKPWRDWILDGAGLVVQGILIPILQLVLIRAFWMRWFPELQGRWMLGFVPSFGLSFVVVDYLYYWNHRLLHSRWLWPIHHVHHTVTEMDVLGTSRNTLWSSVFLLYLWVHALLIYLLQDASGYGLGVSLTAMLDLWRHSRFSPSATHGIDRILSPWFMLPSDHAWHHGRASGHVNFGANFSLWDRLHGTYEKGEDAPLLGIPVRLSLFKALFFPFSR